MFTKAANEGGRADLMRHFVAMSQPIYRKISRRKSNKWCVTVAQLSQYAPESLGGALYYFLYTHQFHLMAHFESHDIFHVLLNYKPTVLDEARMQYCLLGSGRYSAYTIGTCLIALVVYPEYCFNFLQHYQRGRNLQHFSYWDFEALLSETLEKMQEKIKI